MIELDDVVEPEWLEWYRKTPEERFWESQKLFAHYKSLGGSLAPDIDYDSPFWSEEDFQSFIEEAKECRRKAGVELIRRDL